MSNDRRLNPCTSNCMTVSRSADTFFAQFCAGEDAVTIKPTLARLRSAGVGGILDYAAENDVAEEQVAGKVTAGPRVMPAPAAAAPGSPPGTRSFTSSAPVTAASTAYKRSELDENLQETIRGLGTAREEGGFAAVKVTALAQPELLQRVSEVLEGQRRAFRAIAMSSVVSGPAAAHGGTVIGHPAVYTGTRLSREQFIEGMHALGKTAGRGGVRADLDKLFTFLDVNRDGQVDYLDWSDAVGLVTSAGHAVHCAGGAQGAERAAAAAGFASALEMQDALGLLSPSLRPELGRALPGESPALGTHEIQQWVDVLARAQELAAAARKERVTIMVDAEQTYLQPAIDAVGTSAMRQFNRPHSALWRAPELLHLDALETGSKGSALWPYNPASTAATRNGRHGAQSEEPCYPAVYNTYQAYLRDCPSRVSLGMTRARRDGYLFGAKLVRGAYMLQERARAEERGYNDPIHSDIASTHTCYHACANEILTQAVAHGRGEVMIASHNEGSVAYMVGRIQELGLQPRTCGVFFGQLLGMCDFVTLSLGRAGYAAYKYVPYGPVQGVLPYLIRRAQENSDLVAGGVAKELRMLRQELGRRIGMGGSSS